MLKSKKQRTRIKRNEDYVKANIVIDSVTALLIGEREFYYYLIKNDMYLKTILKVIWMGEQKKRNKIKVKAIEKDGNQTYIYYDQEKIQKTKNRQTFEKFWTGFQAEFDQIELINTDTATEKARIRRIINHNSIHHVKRRYKELLLKYHPDKNKSKDSQEKTKETIMAYKFITDNEVSALADPTGFLILMWDDNIVNEFGSLHRISMTDEDNEDIETTIIDNDFDSDKLLDSLDEIEITWKI